MIRATITYANLSRETSGWALPARLSMDVGLSMTSDSYRELDPTKPVYITQGPGELADAWDEGALHAAMRPDLSENPYRS